MVSKYLDTVFYSLYEFSDKKAWYVSANPEVWAVLMISLVTHILIRGLCYYFDIFLLTDLVSVMKGQWISPLLPEIILSHWLVFVFIVIYWRYFITSKKWVDIKKRYSILSATKQKILFLIGGVTVVTSFTMFISGVYISKIPGLLT